MKQDTFPGNFKFPGVAAAQKANLRVCFCDPCFCNRQEAKKKGVAAVKKGRT